MRLISFLGTGNYGETVYTFEGQTCRTCFVANALATFTQPKEIRLIATTEAKSQHENCLRKSLADSSQPNPEFVQVPTGGESQQLWQMFGAIVDVIRTSDDEVLLDITHGFRMQSFFAAACIQYVQAVLPHSPKIRVVYGEYRGPEQESPIWELTPFLDVLSWSRGLMMFLQTGQSDAVVEPTKRLASDLSKQWATSNRQGRQPQLGTLAQALSDFGEDFTTIRTGKLVIGNQSSSQRLWEAIERTRDEVVQRLPALALVLDQVQTKVDPLRTGDARLSSTDGQRVLLALARLYQKMGRFSEAISVLREGWSTSNAPSNCDQPGTDDFDDDQRKQWDNKWAYRDGYPDPTTDVRNDIQHAGFRKRPNRPTWFKSRLEDLLNKWETDINAMETD